ncbi:TonB-dependent receptor [Fusobacteria bacterium ZRK30]|nr:TonB-dependent receptor [Fusobacteria bacterium ZRK30]
MIKRAGVLALILACTVYANDLNEDQFFEESGVIRLEETTISGDGFENTIRDTPKNITIVTAQDIKESGAKNVVEAVKSVPGVKVSEGTGKAGVIDIRGQGATAVQNTAIIVDGIKMNNMDMSGFNLYNIPIETVEKIEIIPSGASVIYGDNTAGGAVVITTKQGKAKDYMTLQTEAGSYNQLDSGFGFGTTAGKFKIFGNAARKNTDGYRENGFLKSDDVMIGTKYQINDANSLTLKYDYHKDYMGFPGSLNEDEVKENPKQTNSSDDWGKNETHRFDLGYNYKKDNLEITNNMNYYIKNYNSFYGFDNDTANISNYFKLKYNTDKNKFITGFDISSGKLEENAYWNPPSSWTKKESYGLFIHDTYSITNKLDLIAGGRYQYTEFDYNGITTEDENYNNYAHELALNYKYSDTGSTFVSWSTDFRTPATDELTYTNPNKNFKPQTGQNLEIGVKDYIWDTYISSSLFYKRVENEIYLDASDKSGGYYGSNVNYEDPNKKIGFELLAEKKFMKKLTLTTSYSYLQSEIDGGEDKGNKTPGVSENKFSLGAKYDFTEKLKSNLILNYVGEAYAHGDFANEQEKIDAHLTLDLNMSYKINDSFDIYGGIKNLTNEEYYEYAGHKSTTGYYYYPAPERQYYVGFRYTM